MVKVPPDLWRQVRETAEAEDRTGAAVVRIALRDYLRDHKARSV